MCRDGKRGIHDRVLDQNCSGVEQYKITTRTQCPARSRLDANTNSGIFSYGLGLTRANTCVTHRYERNTDTRNVSGQNDGCRTPAARVASQRSDRSSAHAKHLLSCFGGAALTAHSVSHTQLRSLLASVCARVAQTQTTPPL